MKRIRRKPEGLNVVAGVTWNTGGAAARWLMARGISLRVIVRDPDKGKDWATLGAEVTVADLSDASTLATAFAGAEAAYVLNPPAYTTDNLFARAEAVAEAVRKAVKKTGLHKLVVLSSIGAHLSTGHGNIRTNWIFEECLGHLNASVTFVRPAYFMENWASVAAVATRDRVLPCFLAPLDRAIPMVSTADVDRVSAEAMLDPGNGTRLIELAGPRPYSPKDAEAAFAKVLGHPMKAVEVPEAEWPGVLARAHFSPRTIESWGELFRGFNSGLITFEGKGALGLQGRVSLDEAIAAILKQDKAPSIGVHS